MKKEHAGWLVAVCLLLALTVVVTLLLARGRTEAQRSPVSGPDTRTETRDSGVAADYQRARPPTKDLSRVMDTVKSEIDAAYAKMREIVDARPQTGTIDGTGGPDEEAGVMPDYHLGNATEHIQKARAAGTDKARVDEIRAARQDLASAKRYLASAKQTILHVPAARIETVPERVATFDPGPTKEVDPVFPPGVYAGSRGHQCTVYGLVDTNGTIIDVQVRESTGVQALDDAVVRAAYATRACPGRFHGVLARVWVRMSYNVPQR